MKCLVLTTVPLHTQSQVLGESFRRGKSALTAMLILTIFTAFGEYQSQAAVCLLRICESLLAPLLIRWGTGFLLFGLPVFMGSLQRRCVLVNGTIPFEPTLYPEEYGMCACVCVCLFPQIDFKTCTFEPCDGLTCMCAFRICILVFFVSLSTRLLCMYIFMCVSVCVCVFVSLCVSTCVSMYLIASMSV